MAMFVHTLNGGPEDPPRRVAFDSADVMALLEDEEQGEGDTSFLVLRILFRNGSALLIADPERTLMDAIHEDMQGFRPPDIGGIR